MFYNCSSLRTIKVSEDNPKFTSVEGVLFDRTDMTLIAYPGGSVHLNYEVPDGTAKIEYGAFAYNRCIRNVKLPSSVKVIDDFAFAGCDSLRKVELAEGVEKIGDTTFGICRH